MALVGTFSGNYNISEYAIGPDLLADLNKLKAGINYIATAQLMADSVDATIHADISASTDPFHSGSSIKITDTGGKWTTDTAQGVADQIAPFLGTGGSLVKLATGAALGQILGWGHTWSGRILTFGTGLMSGGAAAPAVPGGSGIVEAVTFITQTPQAAPLFIVSPLYQPGNFGGSGFDSDQTNVLAYYAVVNGTTSATFVATSQSRFGAVPAWCSWICLGILP
jgi:hypothetical protein